MKAAGLVLQDFCYVANIFQLLHLWIFPNSSFMHKASPGISTRPTLEHAHLYVLVSQLCTQAWALTLQTATQQGLRMAVKSTPVCLVFIRLLDAQLRAPSMAQAGLAC